MIAQKRPATWRELAHDPSLWIALAVFGAVVFLLVVFLPVCVAAVKSMPGGAL